MGTHKIWKQHQEKKVGYPDLYEGIDLESGAWHQITGQPPVLTITIVENSENMPCAHYTLGNTQVQNPLLALPLKL